MKRIPLALLKRMASGLAAEDRDEMAIPSYLHENPVLRWMAWRRLEVSRVTWSGPVSRSGKGPSTSIGFARPVPRE